MAANTAKSAPTDTAPADLEEMLDSIEDAARGGGSVSFGDIFRAVGERSFGPLLLLPGLIILAPIVGDIPGVPTTMALIVILIAGQLLLRRDHFWLPSWLLERSMAAGKVEKAAGWLRKPARFIDRFLRPRLTKFVSGVGEYAIALVTLANALFTPATEVVPFSANAAGAVLTGFGVALIARDGLVAVIALGTAALTAALVVLGLVSG
jgi:hypothetical protein